MPDDPLESLLRRYRPAPPDAALRARILRERRPASHWAFLESMAALLLIGMNLSMIGASVTHLVPTQSATDPARTQQLTAAIEKLDLQLDPQETSAMARRLSSSQSLSLLPIIHGKKPSTSNFGVFP